MMLLIEEIERCLPTPESLADEWARQFAPPFRIKFSDWTKKYGQIVTGGGAGPWTPLPVHEEIEKALGDPATRVCVWKKPHQIAATTIHGLLLSYWMHVRKGKALVTRPSKDAALRYSKEIVDKLFQRVEPLRGLLDPAGATSGENTRMLKLLKNGALVEFASAATPSSAREVTRDLVQLDEVNDPAYRHTEEGDMVQLYLNRATSYPDSLAFITSTPTVEHDSRISEWLEKTDKRRRFYRCLHCDQNQLLLVRNIKEETAGETRSAGLKCIHCGKFQHYSLREEILKTARWEPTKQPEKEGYVGFWNDASESPHYSMQWPKIVEARKDAKKSRVDMIAFQNTVEAEDSSEQIVVTLDAKSLLEKREDYSAGFCPDGVLMLAMGVDVQKDWVAVDVWAMGKGQELWHIFYSEITMNPAVESEWEVITALLLAEWTHASGATLRVKRCGIDLGGSYTNEVYNFVRKSRNSGIDVIATHGSSRYGQPIAAKPKLMDYDFKGELYPAGAMTVALGTDTAKDTLYARAALQPGGPGTIHFGAAATPKYLEGWTAEHKVVSKTSKTAIERYEKKDPNGRNEPIDTSVIALAMFELEPLMGGHQPGKMDDDLQRVVERRASQRRLEKKAEQQVAERAGIQTQEDSQPVAPSTPSTVIPALPPSVSVGHRPEPSKKPRKRRKVGYDVPEDWL